ncbi:MAG: PKD domain-containing protein, partial [Flavobacteriales bacterium]|nr:PKD domain-containing protein [Flavobacteriales bacterium]
PTLPTAQISSDVTSLTLPDSIVNYLDSSLGASFWSWTFNGGSPVTSTAQNPVVAYNSSGSYDASLTVSNSFGCSTAQTLTSYIVVSDPVGSPPIVAFGSDILSGCAPLTVNFYDASANSPDSISWTFIGGNMLNSTDSTPSITFNQAGTYTVTLHAFSQFGADSLTQIAYVTVYPIPTPSISGDSSICNGESTALTGSGGSNYLWNTGQITSSINVNPSANTTYSLIVTDNGCVSSSAFINVTVASAPLGSITPNQIVCLGDQVAIVASGGDSYLWNNGSSADSLVVTATNAPVSYSVEITKVGCPDTVVLTTSVEGANQPLASFTASETLLELSFATATFTNASTYASSYWWDFGDGTTGTDINPWHMYADTGLYDIKMVAANGYCANDTLSLINYIQVIADTNLVGISDQYLEDLSIFPIPFSSDLYLKLNENGIFDIGLSDVLGKDLYAAGNIQFSSGEALHMSLGHLSLSPGVYLLTISTKDTSKHFRVIKD